MSVGGAARRHDTPDSELQSPPWLAHIGDYPAIQLSQRPARLTHASADWRSSPCARLLGGGPVPPGAAAEPRARGGCAPTESLPTEAGKRPEAGQSLTVTRTASFMSRLFAH